MASNEEIVLIFFGCIFALPIAFLAIASLWGITVVKQKEAMIIERWGKFHAKWEAGLHWMCPIMDKGKKIIWREMEANGRLVQMKQTSSARIDMRQNVMDFNLQTIITRDNVEIGVHPLLLFELVDPIRVAYETYDLHHAVEKLVQTTLRSIIGDMGLDDTLASREEINRGILKKIDHVCWNWGIKICRVELLEIVPTPSVQEAMHNQLAAERLRRAAIVKAEGFREKVKTEAEGNCQASIALATGQQQSTVIKAKAESDSKIIVARAEADALKAITDALEDIDVDATQYMIALRYMESLTAIAANASQRKIYLPMETDVVGATSVM